MKKYNRWIFSSVTGLLLSSFMVSCVDEMKFGNAFLEKAPGGTVTKDTVFNNAEYTTQFLNNLYGCMYYGLPYNNTASMETSDIYVGKPEALTDLYVFTYNSALSEYYQGTHTANYGKRSDKYDYTRNYLWQTVRACWLLIENVDGVLGLTDAEKESMKAQAKCIMASRYLDVFRHYGGVPIITGSYSGTDASYEIPRGTVEETVDFIVNLLDEAAAVLPWTVSDPASEFGHWTRAAALAYKCRVLQFAASPLFNSSEPYYPGATDNLATWYGGYDQSRWDRCLAACQEFFNELNANGGYSLQMANGTRPEDYRLAYRTGYANLNSPEVLINTRVIDYDAFKSSYYVWHQWMDYTMSVKRVYCPTQEYIEMFPWSDGKPFDWEETESEGKLDEMFMTATGTVNDALTNITLTRDPRLYEEAVVNGLPESMDWTTGNMAGYPVEAWVGGKRAAQYAVNQSGSFATGYSLQKFVMGQDMLRRYVHWPSIRLSEMYLIYAEALAQSTNQNLPEAVKQVNVVRARVGMKGLEEFTPAVLTDKDTFIAELLRERCCELGMEDARFFDLIRYKRSDVFEERLHGLKIYRLDEDGKRIETPWQGEDAGKKAYPTHFEYEKYELNNPTRYWWTSGFDAKWYLSPFPATEINKGYGLVQNPGW